MESCLLCLELHNESMDSIKVNSTQWHELDIESLIEKHFWSMETVHLSSLLCSACWKQLYDFHKFYKRIEEAHMNFDTIMKIEIANDTDFSMHESVATSQLIVEQNTKQEYDEDLWNDDVPLIEITKNRQVITIVNETVAEDPLSTSKEQYNAETTKTKTMNKEIRSKTSKSRKEVQSKKEFEEEIKPKCGLLKINKEYNIDEDLNSKADSNNEPVKKTTLARSKLNKKKDKFITDNFKLICELCQIPMETFYALSKHFAKEHKQRPFAICCNKKFSERSYLLNHLQQHLSPKYFKCKSCDKICPTHESFKVHCKTHVKKPERNYCCEVCGLSFYTRITLDMHKTRHLSEEEKLFQCLKCGKNFGSNDTLKSHIQRMHGPRLTCDICGLIVVNKFTLAKHKETKHSVDEQEYICPICSKVSFNPRTHEHHIKYVHQTSYKHKCTMCDKAFKKSRALKQHISMHTGIPLNKCPWCPKTFKKDSNLSSHRRKWHSKEWEEVVRKKYSGNLPPNY